MSIQHFTKIAAITAVLPIILACTKENTGEQETLYPSDTEELVDVTMDASLQNPVKTAMTDGSNVSWLPGDCLSVFDAVSGNRRFETDITEMSASAKFSGQVSQGTSTAMVLYPYDTAATFSSDIISTTVQSVQTAVKNSFPTGANVTVGKVDLSRQEGVEMHNSLALLKISITEDGITEVRFRGRDGEKLAGPISIDYSGSSPIVTARAGASETVALRPSSGTFEQGVYYLAVIPTALNSGFWFEMDRSDGTSYKLLGMVETNLARGKFHNFGNVATSRGILSTSTVPAMNPSQQKPVVCWIDAAANLSTFGNDLKAIFNEAKQLKETGFSDIVVDVRPTTGDVLYRSSTAPALTRIDAWHSSSYVWDERTKSFDYLQAWIDAAHFVGLRVFASINAFTGGYLCPYGLGAQGIMFDSSGYSYSANAAKKSWATVLNLSSGPTNAMDLLDYNTAYGVKFMNPFKTEVRNYLLDIIGELAAYDVEGIIMDRCRFGEDIMVSDFSNEARNAYQAYTGTTVSSWPSDIFSSGVTTFQTYSSWDKYYNRENYKKFCRQQSWMSLRAKTIHDFVESASSRVHSVNPSCKFGVYVGAWYSTYYGYGVNWASPNYNCSSDYSWADSSYKNFGFADHCDIMFLGCYASSSSITGSGEWTMQGFASLGKTKAKQSLSPAPIVIGGPDIGNSSGFENGGQGGILYDTMDAIAGSSKGNADGYFVFDICHIRMYDYWDSFRSAISRFRGN